MSDPVCVISPWLEQQVGEAAAARDVEELEAAAAFHFDLSQLQGFSNGQVISSLPDLSGHGCDAATGGANHVYRTAANGINGLPAMERTAGATFFDLPAACADIGLPGSGLTLMIVRREFNAFAPAIQLGAPLIAKYTTPSNRHWRMLTDSFEVEQTITGLDATKVATGFDTENPVVQVARWGPAALTEYRHNCSFVGQAASPASSSPADSAELIRLLGDGDGNQWVGFVGEIIAWGEPLLFQEMDAFAQHLISKWQAFNSLQGLRPFCEPGDVLFFDDFEGDFSATLLTASTPNYPAGATWVETNRAYDIQTSTQRNHARCSGGFIAGPGVIHRDIGLPDVVVRGQVNVSTAKWAGFFCRDSGSVPLNGIEVILNPTTNQIEIYEVVNAVRTLKASRAFPIVIGTVYDLRAELEGSQITVQVNGANQLQATSTHNQTATRFGLDTEECSTGIRFEDFGVYRL